MLCPLLSHNLLFLDRLDRPVSQTTGSDILNSFELCLLTTKPSSRSCYCRNLCSAPTTRCPGPAGAQEGLVVLTVAIFPGPVTHGQLTTREQLRSRPGSKASAASKTELQLLSRVCHPACFCPHHLHLGIIMSSPSSVILDPK